MRKFIVLLFSIYVLACVVNPKPNPQPTPTPTPVPTPTPTPTPKPVGQCPVQPSSLAYEVGLRIESYGTSGKQWDATPYIRSAPTIGDPHPIPPQGWTGDCRARQCDLSPEKDSQNGYACSRELCGDHIDYSLSPSDAGIINWTDGYKVKLTLSKPAKLTGVCPITSATSTIDVQ